jgi:hypothetical protein
MMVSKAICGSQTKPIAIKPVWSETYPEQNLSGENLPGPKPIRKNNYRDITYRPETHRKHSISGPKPIGGQNLSVQNLSAEQTLRRTKPFDWTKPMAEQNLYRLDKINLTRTQSDQPNR